MALETELNTYRARLPELESHIGEFVLIRGDQVIDFFAAYEDAMKRGYQLFKLDPFMVKQIETLETVHSITRFLQPAPSHEV